jgi:lambda family phage portal protein
MADGKMKFSFSVEKSKPFRTGAMIQTRRAMPDHAKFIRDFNRRQMRMFEASVSNNLNADFPVSITSANAEILVSISQARSRARRLERDNPYVWAILQSFQDNVGGDDPFRLEMKVGKQVTEGDSTYFEEETETNRMIEEAWEDAGLPENCTVRRDISRFELDMQTITAFIRDGGILHRQYRAFPKNKFGYALEPIESDRLDHYYNRPSNGTNREIQFSIEMDEYHAPVIYWILTRHPGDVFAFSNQVKYREPVPAEDIIPVFDIRTRAGQYVAMPRLHSIIKRLHQIDQFDEAHVTAAIWAACKPLFITQEIPTANEYVSDIIKGQLQNDMVADGRDAGDKMSNVEPGSAEILQWGQKPVLMDPKFPIEAAAGFKKDQLRAAAAGSGTSYHAIGQDLEGVNFSSGRLGLQQFHDTCKKMQRHLIMTYRRPHFNEWLKYAILSGQLDLPISRLDEFRRAARFFGRRWPYVNPLQDAQADILRIEAGLDSRSRVIAESDRGGDVEQVDAEQASDKECDEAHDLDFSAGTPTTPTLKKGQVGEELPAVNDDAAQPPAKKGGKQTIKSKRRKRLNWPQRHSIHEISSNGHVA